jgi:hypothetical protein
MVYEAIYETYASGIEISLGLFKKKEKAEKAILKRAKLLGTKNHTYSFEGWVLKRKIK